MELKNAAPSDSLLLPSIRWNYKFYQSSQKLQIFSRQIWEGLRGGERGKGAGGREGGEKLIVFLRPSKCCVSHVHSPSHLGWPPTKQVPNRSAVFDKNEKLMVDAGEGFPFWNSDFVTLKEHVLSTELLSQHPNNRSLHCVVQNFVRYGQRLTEK